MAEGDRLELKALRPEQKFTQPPARFSEATLVKELEENGIGRPSTYASIIAVLQDREYVYKVEGRFKPAALGRMISDLLAKSFVDLIDVEYTRSLEEDLDKIEQGKAGYVKTLTAFYKKFKKDLARARQGDDRSQEGHRDRRGVRQMRQADAQARRRVRPLHRVQRVPGILQNTREVEVQEPESESGEEIEPCENCGRPMVVKRGRFGQFLACTGYPECKTTRKVIATKQGGLKAAKPDQILDEKCPRCGSNLVIKQGRFGEFTACTSYPTCKYIKHKTTGVKCPKGRLRAARSWSGNRSAENVLRLLELSRLRFRALEPAAQRTCPEMQAVPHGEDHQEARPSGHHRNTDDCDYSRGGGSSKRGVIPGLLAAGLAGCEAAWRIASLGVAVTLHEMRPVRPTAVHKTGALAELVCSNSFRGDKLDNAVGLLKEEMRRLGSLVMRVAEESRVPAGAALAVDRERFAQLMSGAR